MTSCSGAHLAVLNHPTCVCVNPETEGLEVSDVVVLIDQQQDALSHPPHLRVR